MRPKNPLCDLCRSKKAIELRIFACKDCQNELRRKSLQFSLAESLGIDREKLNDKDLAQVRKEIADSIIFFLEQIGVKDDKEKRIICTKSYDILTKRIRGSIVENL